MRVLIVNALYTPYKIGGAEKSVQLLAEGLARRGEAVTVVTLHEDAAPEEADLNGVHLIRLPLDNRHWPYGAPDADHGTGERLLWHLRNSWNRAAAARFGRVLDAVRPDVVHCNVITGFSVAIWREVRRRQIPLVQTLRDYGLICCRSSLFKAGRNCQTRCGECRVLTHPARGASRRVDQLVSNSNHVIAAHQALGYFAGVPARRIFNVVDLAEAPRQPASPSGAPLVFGFIGRIEAEKGIEVVLAAFARLARADWRLRIAGVGRPEYVAVLRAAYPDPRIVWLDFVTAGDFYRSIDVVLIASIWAEPLPRTLIEALGAGVAAICSDAGGIPEIADLGLHTITYPAEDPVALAEAMSRALAEADAWRKGGLKDPAALALFSEAAIVDAYRAVYADARASAGRVHRVPLNRPSGQTISEQSAD